MDLGMCWGTLGVHTTCFTPHQVHVSIVKLSRGTKQNSLPFALTLSQRHHHQTHKFPRKPSPVAPLDQRVSSSSNTAYPARSKPSQAPTATPAPAPQSWTGNQKFLLAANQPLLSRSIAIKLQISHCTARLSPKETTFSPWLMEPGGCNARHVEKGPWILLAHVATLLCHLPAQPCPKGTAKAVQSTAHSSKNQLKMGYSNFRALLGVCHGW